MKPLIDYAKEAPFIVCAHRGNSAFAPENTLSSIQQALDIGVPMVEVDVQVTSDNILVALHDATLNRTTNGVGFVADHPYSALLELDAGSWFSPEFASEKIPTFENVCDALHNRAYMNVEIKPLRQGADASHHSALMTKTVQEVTRRNALETTLFTSFDVHALQLLRTLEPNVRTLVLQAPHSTAEPDQLVGESLANAYGCAVHELTSTRMAHLSNRGIPVGLYTINDVSTMLMAIHQGVRGAVTNHPASLLAALRHLGLFVAV
jgi:glycerophosphoryl diester phosphodiesterase